MVKGARVGVVALTIAMMSALPAFGVAPDDVTIATPVTDQAGVLSAADEEALAASLVAHREKTGIQIAVLMVDTTKPEEIDDFSQQVFERWGGGHAQRDDGVLFVLAINDRRSRLHLGYGIEALISDGHALEMLADLRPALRRSDYKGAAEVLLNKVFAVTAHVAAGDDTLAPPLGAGGPGPLVVLFIFGVAVGVLRKVLPRPLVPDDDEEGTYARSKRRRRWVDLGMLGAVPLALMVVFHRGELFWLAYPVAWLFFVGFGVVLALACKKWGWRLSFGGVLAFFVGFVFVTFVSSGVAASRATLFATGVEVGVAAFAVTVLCFVLLALGIVTALLSLASGGSGGGSSWSSSGSSWSSGSSSSSWSSSSSSSSSYSSGSSSSSSSWSGGGGSSGGGGASSSW